jgi:hypothetical protein
VQSLSVWTLVSSCVARRRSGFRFARAQQATLVGFSVHPDLENRLRSRGPVVWKERGTKLYPPSESYSPKCLEGEFCEVALIEGVIGQLKDFFALEGHRAKTLGGLLTPLAAKIAAYTCAQRMNHFLGRPLRRLADLLI